MNKLAILCVIFFIFTGCGEPPVDVEQTAEPTAVPTPVPTEFVPAPLEPAELTQEQWEQMQQTTTCMTADGAVDEKISTRLYPLRYVDYYGTYGGYIAIRIYDTQWTVTNQEEVAGCTLYYSGYGDILFCRVLLWKDNTFYYLQYAYDHDLITAEDVKTIAYYNNLRHFEPIVSASPAPNISTSLPEDFVPQTIEPAELSEEVWERIRNTYQHVLRGEFWKGPFIEYHTNPQDLIYCGTYHGYIAFFIKDLSPYDWRDGRYDEIYLWKDDVFYHVQDALNLGFITDKDVENIIYYFKNNRY